MELLAVTPVDPTAPQSPALQAYRILERAFESASLPPGSKLPAERDLAQQLGVSRSTLRQVLAALADSDLVEASPQRGWFIADGPMSDPPNVLVSFTESARLRGIEAGARVLSQAVRSITLAEQDDFRAAPGTDILELHRLRLLDGTPVCVDVSRVVLPRVPGIEHLDFENSSLYEAMSTIGGTPPNRSDYAVHADAADEETAELLGVAVGSPVLVGTELTYAADGVPLLAAQLTYRGDAYTFRATLYDR